MYGSATSGRVPIGVLVEVDAVAALGQVLLDARLTGLLIAVVTMGALFVALFFVVRRADRIITTRTVELETAYGNLRASESIRNDLTYMIVHDLRNPLTAIFASLDLIGRANQDGQGELRSRFVGNAKAGAVRMTGLIDDMLSVSKIESGELKPQCEMVALSELLADRVGGFAAQATAQNKLLTFNCADEVIVSLDPVLIGRVVDNLISNAFKYTDEVHRRHSGLGLCRKMAACRCMCWIMARVCRMITKTKSSPSLCKHPMRSVRCVRARVWVWRSAAWWWKRTTARLQCRMRRAAAVISCSGFRSNHIGESASLKRRVNASSAPSAGRFGRNCNSHLRPAQSVV